MAFALWLIPVAALAAPPALRNAIARYERFEWEAATRELRAILATSPEPVVAAAAPLYLGLIDRNFRVDARHGRDEFRQALLTDPLIALPPSASPKAHRIFEQVQAETEAQPAAPRPPPRPSLAPPATAEAPSVPVPFASSEAEPPPAHGHGLGIGLLSGGLAFAVLTGVSALEIVHYNGAFAGAENQSPGTVAYTGAVAAAQSAANSWQIVEIVAAILAVGGVGAAPFVW